MSKHLQPDTLVMASRRQLACVSAAEKANADSPNLIRLKVPRAFRRGLWVSSVLG